MRVEGADSANVALLANDLRRVRVPVAKADEYASDIAEASNLKAKR